MKRTRSLGQNLGPNIDVQKSRKSTIRDCEISFIAIEVDISLGCRLNQIVSKRENLFRKILELLESSVRLRAIWLGRLKGFS